jgi:hypothetical protein
MHCQLSIARVPSASPTRSERRSVSREDVDRPGYFDPVRTARTPALKFDDSTDAIPS